MISNIRHKRRLIDVIGKTGKYLFRTKEKAKKVSLDMNGYKSKYQSIPKSVTTDEDPDVVAKGVQEVRNSKNNHAEY